MLKHTIPSALILAIFIIASLICSPLLHAAPSLTVEDFVKEADLRSAKISPNGKYLATLWNKDQYRYLSIQDISQPGSPMISSLGDRIRRPKSILWANDERLLVTIEVPVDTKSVEKDLKRKKDFDIYDYFLLERTLSVDLKIKNPVVLMNDDRRFRYNVRLSNINFIDKDDQHVLMTAYRNGTLQLFKVNIYTGESERVARGNSKTYSFLYDEYGIPKIRFDYYSRANKVILRKFIDETKWEKIDTIDFDEVADSEEHALRIEDLVGWYNDKLAYRKRNENTGFYEIIVRNINSGEVATLVSLKNKDVQGLIYDKSRNIVGYWPLDDLVRYQYFDENRQKEYDSLASQLEHFNFYYHGKKNAVKSIIKTYGRDLPGTFFIYDHNNNNLTFLQDMYLNLTPEKLAVPAQVKFYARDNTKIHTHILLPPEYQKGKRYPLVILPHGGPHARDTSGYDDFAQFIATRGYLVAQPNFRGSTGFGKDFEELGYKQWGLAMQDDLVDTARFLVKKGYADKDKICIAGISYGGYAALMGAIKTENLFKCSVSINGVTHLAKIIKYDVKNIDVDGIEELIYQRIGHPENDRAYLEENSPALHADKVKIPLLIIAGTEDSIVPYNQAKLMTKALKKAKKDFSFIPLKDTGHNPFYYRDDQEKVYTEIEKFLAKYL